MKTNKLYAVSNWQDYEGGGIIAVFSTYEKAKSFYDKQEPNACESYSTMEIEIDSEEACYSNQEIDNKHG